MGPRRNGEVESSSLNYPSPRVETMETGPFYNANSRDSAQENGENGQQDTNDQLPVEQDQRHNDGQEEAEHASRPANLEELQLAAQLGQNLAGATMLPATDPTDPNMSVEQGNMQDMIPHPDSDSHGSPTYVHDTPTSEHMAQHSMQVPVGSALAQYAMGDGVPPRKRCKVSRACDECRRKKIKCDAQSDTGEAPCSSCARSAIQCLFSRVPQKRGPSKGYIKELADRINSIESKLESEGGLSQDEIDKLFAADRHRGTNGSASADEANRKRPYSSISNEYSTPVGSRQAPWGSEARSIQAGPPQSDTYYRNNSSLAPQALPVAHEVTCKHCGNEEAGVGDVGMEAGEHVPKIDEGVLNDFLTSVQPLYPILSTTKSRQESLLAQCPLSVRTAFEIALLAVGQSTAGDVQQASALLHDWESSSSSSAARTRATDIVHAQTLLLLIIDADWRSVATLPFLLSRAVGLANSMKLWKLGAAVEASSSGSEEADSDHALCTRIWWSLVGMDRWYAAGTGKPAQIPDSSVVAPAGLEGVLGETCFYFTRLSKLLNRISFVMSRLPAGVATASAGTAAILDDYVENYREDLPGHVDATSYPLIHLAYWHCRLLVTLLTPGATAAETLWPTGEMTLLLLGTPASGLRSPLVNHFVSLAAMSVTTLCRAAADKTREEAVGLAREIVERSGGGGGGGGGNDEWAGVRDGLAEVVGLRRGSSTPDAGAGSTLEVTGTAEAAAAAAAAVAAASAAASHGLQHLADLATAHEGTVCGEGEGGGAKTVAASTATTTAPAPATATAPTTTSLASGYLEVA